MKKCIHKIFKISIVLLLPQLLASTAEASFGCGFKPFPPFGCKSDSAQCACRVDSYGKEHCEWIFTDCR
jgi:hypothetical protein